MATVLHYEKYINKDPNKPSKVVGHAQVKTNIRDVEIILGRVTHFRSEGKEWFNFGSSSKKNDDGTYQYIKDFQCVLAAHNGEMLEDAGKAIKAYLGSNGNATEDYSASPKVKPLFTTTQNMQMPIMDDELPF